MRSPLLSNIHFLQSPVHRSTFPCGDDEACFGVDFDWLGPHSNISLLSIARVDPLQIENGKPLRFGETEG
jgi:hypothetical protein